jgi:hypothetical protein
MGGTWIHNQQGFVWRELARYGMDRNLKLSPNEDYASHAYSMARRNGKSAFERGVRRWLGAVGELEPGWDSEARLMSAAVWS